MQPQICVELVNETSKLLHEVTLDPSVVDADTYSRRYLTESGSAGFGGHTLGQDGGGAGGAGGASTASGGEKKLPPVFLSRNCRDVASTLKKQGVYAAG